MREKKEKNVRKRRPLMKPARWMLKFTQHVSACVCIICVVALFLEGSVYVENYGHRSYVQMYSGNTEQVVSDFFESYLHAETRSVIRFATIRSQLETDGAFDLDRKINISEYYYRKNIPSFSDTGQRTYFPEAVYYLEDLIRWQQSGGIRYLGTNYTYNAIVQNAVTDTALVETPDSGSMVNMVDNMFLTINKESLEEVATNAKEYRILVEQLSACMIDLGNNYSEYQKYLKEYAEDKTSFVYYIYMDNEAGDIYTNSSRLKGMARNGVHDFFSNGLVCAAVGTTSLSGIQNELTIPATTIASYMSEYDYAFGDNAVIYTGIDIREEKDDYFNTLYKAILGYDAELMYILTGVSVVCGLYYLFAAVYLMYAAGRRVSKEGEEFIEVKWSDSVVTEVFLGWCAVLGYVVACLLVLLFEYYMRSPVDYISEVNAIGIMAAAFVVSILVTESLCSLARRYKAGTLLKNSILYMFVIAQLIKLFKYFMSKAVVAKRKIQYYLERSGLWERTWGILMIELVFYAVCMIIMYIFIRRHEDFLALSAAGLLLGVAFFIAYRRMRRKIEREHIIEKIEGIVAGEGSRVEEEKLSFENAALGHAVNEIGEGIRAAVETSTKDERLKAELLTNVSHDIKTPLTSIISYIDLLKKEEINSDKAKEYIDVLENKSLKLKNLIQDLIEVSKISTGNIEYEMMPLNLHELLMQAAGEYDEKFEEHCLKMIYNNHAKEAFILADPRRMWRVVENLLSNVYKYALEGTRVYLEVVQTDNELTLTMKNISAKELNIRPDELAERFVRGDLSRTTEGSGLGLAIAENLVEGQGGKFDIMLDGDLFKVQFTFKVYEK